MAVTYYCQRSIYRNELETVNSVKINILHSVPNLLSISILDTD